MGIFFLFVSNVEYIGLLVVLIALISDAQIQTIRRNWGIAGTLLLLFTLMSYDIKNAIKKFIKNYIHFLNKFLNKKISFSKKIKISPIPLFFNHTFYILL